MLKLSHELCMDFAILPRVGIAREYDSFCIDVWLNAILSTKQGFRCSMSIIAMAYGVWKIMLTPPLI